MFNLSLKKMSNQQRKTVDLEYEDLLKIEFLDMVARFSQERTLFHIYAIGRCATTATLVGFSYNYRVEFQKDNPVIIKTINLNEYGELAFKILPDESYGELITKDRHRVVQNLLDNFPTNTKVSNFPISNY